MKITDIIILLPWTARVAYSFQNYGSSLHRPLSIYNINTRGNIYDNTVSRNIIRSSSSFSLLYKRSTSLHTFPAVKSSTDDNKSESLASKLKLKFVIPVAVILGIGLLLNANGISLSTLKSFDIAAFLESTVEKIGSLGPLGYLYFSLIYIAAEVLAIPVMPLTASSGYLFGLLPGAALVLLSATIAACISFFIGRTFLRDWAREKTAGNAMWKMIDTAVGREGFKIILLLRLSPLLPFALSNYLYGITSVDFGSYFLATLLGFAPGSFGIVYAGSAGKALLDHHGGSFPWYYYVGVGGFIFLAGKYVAKIASDAVKQAQLEDEQETAIADALKNKNDDKNEITTEVK